MAQHGQEKETHVETRLKYQLPSKKNLFRLCLFRADPVTSKKGYGILLSPGGFEKQKDLKGCKWREEDGTMMEQRKGTQTGNKQVMQSRTFFVKRNKEG